MLTSGAKGSELVLALTDRCTASCSSCPLCCGPDCRDEMDVRLAEGLIDQASSMGFRRVTLAGGEPFLLPGLVRELLEYARDRGVEERCVATNGFWGEWPDGRIEDDVQGLKGLLTHMTFAFDAFHAEHVGADAFWRAVRSVDSMPVHVVIAVADVRGNRGAGAFLATLGDDAMGRSYLVYPLPPEGRAKDLPGDCFVEGLGVAGLGAASRKTLFVNWDGGIYPSYHPGIPRMSSRLGDATHDSLAQALSREGAMLEKRSRGEV